MVVWKKDGICRQVLNLECVVPYTVSVYVSMKVLKVYEDCMFSSGYFPGVKL